MIFDNAARLSKINAKSVRSRRRTFGCGRGSSYCIKSFIPSVLTGILICSWAAAQPKPEVRGTWLTTTANDALATPAKTAATMKRLRELGLNTVYVECWKNGYTEFSSDALKKAIGVDHKLNLPDQPPDRDLLREAAIEAHRNQLLCFGWFEYGFAAGREGSDNELVRKTDWLSQDIHGSTIARDGFIWLNPVRPECQNLIIGIVVDAIRNHDLDGVQLDDRLCWPGLEMGYDPYTRQLYAAEHDGKQPPDDPYDRQWVKWRADKVSEFARRLVSAARSANPEILISLSPAPFPFSRDVSLCDWTSWPSWSTPQSKAWDEFVPQCYRANYAEFEKCWNEQLAAVGAAKVDLVAGIRLVGDGNDLPANDAEKCVALVRRSGAMGHCWWFSRGLLGPFSSEIARLYKPEDDGYAAHPRRAADWRPEPAVAMLAADKQHFQVRLDPGKYRAIFMRDDHWEEADQPLIVPHEIVYDPKIQARRIEFLVDRRP
jgi:uncharacterized lipoprotein YddW (UPF0748 family)